MKRIFGIAFLLVGALCVGHVHAQKKTVLPEESCTDGYYTGPRAGRQNYSNDKYLWVVTREFAERFCVPPEFIDETLKGAEAIAFRMSTQEGMFDRCAINDDKEICAGDQEIRFDIFLRSDLNLPAANPEVKFYDGSRNDAGWHLSLKERLTRRERYISGEYRLPPGELPHFKNPFYYPNEGYTFGLVGVYQGSALWPITGLSEWGYRANWAKDLDLLILQAHPGWGFKNERMDALDTKRFAIVLGRQNEKIRYSERRVPEDFSHAIWLPEKFFKKVRAAATTRGKTWFEQLRTLRQQ